MHYNAILRSCVYLNVATCAHEYCGRAPVLCSRSALFQSKFVCDGCDRCSGSAARFVPPSRVRRFHEQLCCVVCLAALLRCHSMSLASDAESHKREESLYRYFMEQLVWLEIDAIHSGDFWSDSYLHFHEAVARKSVLTVCLIRSVGPRWCFEVGSEDASRFSSGCDCTLSKTCPEVDGVWARGRYETVRIAAWRDGNAFSAEATWKSPEDLDVYNRPDLHCDDTQCWQWLANVQKFYDLPAEHSARWLFYHQYTLSRRGNVHLQRRGCTE